MKNQATIACILFALLTSLHADEHSERLKRAEAVAREARMRQYASDIALAQMAWQLGKLDRATALLDRHRPSKHRNESPERTEDPIAIDCRGMEWHLLWRMMHAEKLSLVNESNPLSTLAFTPDDSQLLSGEVSYTYNKPTVLKAWSVESLRGEKPAGSKSPADEQSTASNKVIWTQEATPVATSYLGLQSLAQSADGKWLAFPDNQVVHVLNRDTGDIEWTMRGHTDFVVSVAISPDGKLLASGGLDKKLNVWSLETGELIESLPGHELGILAIAFSPDGKSLAAGGGDNRAPDWHLRKNGELKIWMPQSDDEPRTVKVPASVSSVEYSSDNHFIAVGLFDGKTLLLNAKDGAILRTIDQPSSVSGVCFSPDAKVLATATTDGLVKLWEAGTGSELATFRGHRGRVDCLAFSHNGLWLASAGMDRTIRIWDANVYPERTRIALPAWSIHTAAFSEDSKSLMVSDYNHVWLITPETNRTQANWSTNHWTVAAAVSPDGTRVATAGTLSTRGNGGSLVRLWNVADSSKPMDLAVPFHRANSVAFSRDGQTLLTHCESEDQAQSSIRLYSVDTGEAFQVWDDAFHAAFSPDGHSLAVGLADEIVLYDFHEKKLLGRFTGEESQANALEFSPDGKRLASASFQHSLHIWDVATQKEVTELNGHEQVVDQIHFSPDGQSLASADSNQTIVWELADSTMRFALPYGSCPMTFTRDNHSLITAPGEVHFWQVATGEELLTFPHYGYDSRTLTLSPDGKNLAQAGGNRDESNGVWIWSTR